MEILWPFQNDHLHRYFIFTLWEKECFERLIPGTYVLKFFEEKMLSLDSEHTIFFDGGCKQIFRCVWSWKFLTLNKTIYKRYAFKTVWYRKHQIYLKRRNFLQYIIMAGWFWVSISKFLICFSVSRHYFVLLAINSWSIIIRLFINLLAKRPNMCLRDTLLCPKRQKKGAIWPSDELWMTESQGSLLK